MAGKDRLTFKDWDAIDTALGREVVRLETWVEKGDEPDPQALAELRQVNATAKKVRRRYLASYPRKGV